MNNPYLFEFECRAKTTIKMTVLCTRAPMRTFLSDFGSNCPELQLVSPKGLRTFMYLAVREQPASILEAYNKNFLVEPGSLKQWLLYFKVEAQQGIYETYIRKEIVYIAIYAVRYTISKHHAQCCLRQDLREMIHGKEFATFVLKNWTGKGIVGIATTSDGKRRVLREFLFQNTNLAMVYRAFFESGIATIRISEFNYFADQFEISLGPYADRIKSMSDFGEDTFFQQVKYFKTKYFGNDWLIHKALRHIIGFYRYVVNSEEGSRIFDSGKLSPAMIRHMNVLRMLMEDWEMIEYKSIDPKEKRGKLAVVMRDIGTLGTRFVDGDAVLVDISIVESSKYRQLIWRYIRAKFAILRDDKARQLAFALHIIEEDKRQSGIAWHTITFGECSKVYLAFCALKHSDVTLKTELCAVKTFLKWAAKNGHIQIESVLCLAQLTFRSETARPDPNGKAITPHDLNLMLNLMRERATTPHRQAVYVASMVLARTTLRPSEVCQLDIDCLHIMPGNIYAIKAGRTKTSAGDKVMKVCDKTTRELLHTHIESTAGIRRKCFDPAISSKVFLYQATNGFKYLKEKDLKADFSEVCQELGINSWGPYSFRKMQASFWDEEDRVRGRNGELAAAGMGHKSYDTTRRNYVDRTIDEFRRLENADKIGTDEQMKKEWEQLLKNQNNK